jgi:hypothetical protein
MTRAVPIFEPYHGRPTSRAKSVHETELPAHADASSISTLPAAPAVPLNSPINRLVIIGSSDVSSDLRVGLFDLLAKSLS